MKKAFTWLMLLTVTALFAMSVTPALAHTEGDPQQQPIYAGSPHPYTEWWEEHRFRVGWIYVWNDGVNLHVTYSNWGIGMDETHLAVAESLDDIPQTKSGNPKVGQFPYKHEGLGGVLTDPYTIPLDGWGPGTELVIAAHAALVNGETAWADCGGPLAQFPGNSWATYFNYTVQ